MSTFNKKIQIRTADKKITKFDLSKYHLTTQHWFQANVVYFREMMPKSRIKIDMETFSRLAPMPSPTIGAARIVNRAFFVPFRMCWKQFNDWVENAPIAGQTAGTFPTITQTAIQNWFVSETTLRTVVENPSTIPYNYDFGGEGWSGVYYKFTPYGAYCNKILSQLGMNISLFSRDSNFTFSAMPLMAIAKVFMDYYSLAQYQNYADYSYINNLASGSIVTPTTMGYLLKALYNVGYESDYFTSAFDNPNTSLGSNSAYSTETYDIVDQSLNDSSVGVSSKVVASSTQDPAVVATSTKTPSLLTQYVIDTLKSLSDFLKRRQLVGSRTIDRYLAEYGVKLNNNIVNRCYYIDKQQVDVVFDDVMSTSDTTSAALGDYAGKGYTKQERSKPFEFQTDEFGYFIIVSVISPRIGYYQGVRKHALRTSRLEFYHGDFDALGSEPILKNELYNNGNGTGVFGFTPRYSSYKIDLDNLTGNFSLKTNETELQSWHLFRDMALEDQTTQIQHNPQFCLATDNEQYNRIFYTDDGYDKFKVLYNFYVEVWQPCKKLYDTYEFKHDGQDIMMDENGTRLV